MRSSRICGVDEVGRGPWAGPVVAAAVVLPPQADWLSALDDSKRLTPCRRERLARAIRREAEVALGWASPAEIDRHGILEATMAAMRRAIARLDPPPTRIRIDGNRIPDRLRCPAEAIVGGDRLDPAIAAASIVAKVTRDRWMRWLDRRYPGYGFARHKGYGTRAHAEALARLGPCPIHRRSFRPVRDACALDHGRPASAP